MIHVKSGAKKMLVSGFMKKNVAEEILTSTSSLVWIAKCVNIRIWYTNLKRVPK